MRFKLIPITLLAAVVQLFAITRQDIWGNGIKYFIGWHCLIDTAWILDANGDTIYPKYESVFKKSEWYIAEAYCLGGWDSPEAFLSRINSGVCPGGENTSDYGKRPDGTSNARYYLAGIDCAVFVNRCFQLDYGPGIQGIKDNCLNIEKQQAKMGDALVIPTHARLVVENFYPNVCILESTPPQVRGLEDPIPIGSYEAYSIFPQFTNEKPTNGSEVYEKRPEISIEVTGSGVIDIPYMLLDGNPVPPSCQQIENGIKVIHQPTADLKDDNHIVEIKATNNQVNLYEDSYTWSFKVHAECPMVISTDPSNGMSEVDVYGNITISFNKEMNPGTVNNGTVLFSPALSGGFTPSWSGDNKTVTLIISDPQKDLKFQTSYTVTVMESVTDKDGVHLDGDKDGKAGGNSTKFDVDLLRLQNTIENNKEV